MGNAPEGGSVKSLKLLLRNKLNNNAENFNEMLTLARGDVSGEDVKIGVLLKEFKSNDDANEGSNLAGWEKALKENDSSPEVVDITGGISLVMAVKEEIELDLLKKSSVLSNKALKHGFIPLIKDIINRGGKVTHEKLADVIEGIIEDPSKIELNVPDLSVEYMTSRFQQRPMIRISSLM